MMKKIMMREKKNRKISKRPLTSKEKILLILLLGLVAFYLIFRFILEPQKDKLNSLEAEKNKLEQEIHENNRILKSESKIKEEWQELNKEKEIIVADFFPSLDQAQIIYLLNELLLIEDLETVDFNFSKPIIEIINDKEVRLMEAYLPFKGGYQGIIEVLKAMEKSSKKIIISDIDLEKEEGYLSGNMNLKIYSLEGIANTNRDVIHVETTDNNKGNPFTSYKDYREPNYQLNEEENEDLNNIHDGLDNYETHPNGSINDFPKNNPNKEKEEKEDSTKELGGKEVIFNFGDGKYEFFPNNPNLQGTLSKSDMSKSGKGSLKLDYAAYPSKNTNSSYIDLAMNDIIINNKEDELALWIYSSSKSSGGISLSYKDSSHKDRIISIAEGIAWTGWEKRKLPLPDNLKFPLIMNKIILEFPSDQEEFGTLLFDSIERNEEYIYYQVKAGDTITGISQKIYKTNKHVDEILKLNKMKYKNILTIGRKIKLRRPD